MNSFVRGGAVLVFISSFVVMIYTQTQTGSGFESAVEPQIRISNNTSDISNTSLNNNNEVAATTSADTDDVTKLVKTTGSVKAAGASRGSFSATAYCLRGRTATGGSVRRGIIAADPRVLRLGSSVRLEGGGYNGTYQVTDTGGRIKGKKIDIWVPSCGEARKFGRRNIQVFSN